MAHYDVVPVNEENWEKPPFAGILEDGVLWGRGTLDTKVTFNGILSAANYLIGKKFQPENDIYFAFSGGEEVNGPGAPSIVQYFLDEQITPAIVVDEGGGKKFQPENDIYFAFSGGEEVNGPGAPSIVQYFLDEQITPAIVVDEGGAVVENVFPGVKQPCGLIGIAEKGLMNAQFRTVSAGGHASAPKPHTPVGVLSAACKRVEDHPFKAHIDGPAALMFDTLGRHSTFAYRMIFANLWCFVLSAACKRVEDHPFKAHIDGPAALMFDTLGRHSTFAYRMIFANLWCFGWIIDLLGKKSGGEMNALVRTTVAFTQMEGSSARNVIPPQATMVANMRLNPDERPGAHHRGLHPDGRQLCPECDSAPGHHGGQHAAESLGQRPLCPGLSEKGSG